MTEQSPEPVEHSSTMEKRPHRSSCTELEQEVALGRDGGRRQGSLVSAVGAPQSMCSCTCFSFSCFVGPGGGTE